MRLPEGFLDALLEYIEAKAEFEARYEVHNHEAKDAGYDSYGGPHDRRVQEALKKLRAFEKIETALEKDERMFPIQSDWTGKTTMSACSIPWKEAEIAYRGYSALHPGQTLEQLARRGGFGHQEFYAYYGMAKLGYVTEAHEGELFTKFKKRPVHALDVIKEFNKEPR
jgi:hypothetical protein